MARRTFNQIIEQVTTNVGFHTQWTDPPASSIVAGAARDIQEAWQWSMRKRVTLLQTAPPVSQGTITVRAGSPTVTGLGTQWTVELTGRAIRIPGDPQFFYVAQVLSPTNLTIGDYNLTTIPWIGPSAAGVTYDIFPIQYALPLDVDKVLLPTQDWPLEEKTVALFDELDPLRTSRGKPQYFAYSLGMQRNGTEVTPIEFWPVPDLAYTIRLPYLRRAIAAFSAGDIPLCPTELVEQLATIRACAYLHTKSGDARWLDQVEKVWGPMFAAQMPEAERMDQERYGLPEGITGDDLMVGFDRLSTRDWDLM